jgi:hypothetical protein
MALRLMRRPHVLLVIFLMAMLAVFPFIERSGVGRCIVNLLIVTSIVVALHRVRVRRTGVLIVAVLGALAVTGQILHEAKVPGPAGVVSAVSQTLFYAIAAGLMCIYMLGDTRATIDELFAAAAAYMLGDRFLVHRVCESGGVCKRTSRPSRSQDLVRVSLSQHDHPVVDRVWRYRPGV